jgi:hypothetical protein
MSERSVEATEAKTVGEWLQVAIGVPFIVVGGGAIAQEVRVATKDVDVLINRKNWEEIDSAIENHPEAAPLEPFSGTIRGTVVRIGEWQYDVEFISGEPFSGRYPAERFVRFVREHGSAEYDGIRYARPAVVFYMRLVTEDWQVHVDAIERDVRAGVSRSTLDRALRIAERFGTQKLVRERLAYVRKTMSNNDPRRE